VSVTVAGNFFVMSHFILIFMRFMLYVVLTSLVLVGFLFNSGCDTDSETSIQGRGIVLNENVLGKLHLTIQTLYSGISSLQLHT